MPKDTDLSDLIINKLTQAQFQALVNAGTVSETELYMITDADVDVTVDDNSITKNSQNQIQTVGVINQNNTTIANKNWVGTRAEYDALVADEDIDDNTIYTITDDENIPVSILELLYPVGAIYIGTMATCPLQLLGIGTWQLKTSRFLVDKQEPTDSKPIGWNKYSDGYCEQFWKANCPSTINTTIQLPIAFKDTNYTIIGALADYTDLYPCGIAAYPATSSTFYALSAYDGTGYTIPCTWYACGYTLETTQFNQWERIS